MQPDHQVEIEAIAQAYFEGLHNGDVSKLRSVFSSDCQLQAPGVRRNLNQWFQLVKHRAVPAVRGDRFGYKILSIEVLGEQAMVKVLCPLLGKTYIDFLGLLFESGRWQIVNKMYADQPNKS